jgi:hypothetical protein
MSCATPILPAGPLGHVAEIVGHDPETAGHVRPKYAREACEQILAEPMVLKAERELRAYWNRYWGMSGGSHDRCSGSWDEWYRQVTDWEERIAAKRNA